MRIQWFTVSKAADRSTKALVTIFDMLSEVKQLTGA